MRPRANGISANTNPSTVRMARWTVLLDSLDGAERETVECFGVATASATDRPCGRSIRALHQHTLVVAVVFWSVKARYRRPWAVQDSCHPRALCAPSIST